MSYQHTQQVSYDYGKTFNKGNSATYTPVIPTESSSRVVKTKVDADGWRPMTDWSKGTLVDKTNKDILQVYGTGVVDLTSNHLVIRSTNTKVYFVRMSTWTSWPSEANVKNAALGKLKDQQLNVVMLLKDRRETLQGISDRLQALYRGVRHARRGELVKSAQVFRKWWRSRTPGTVNRFRAANQKTGKPLANMWLELNFLHMQVISDANGLIEELSRDPQVGFLHGRSGLSEQKTDTIQVQASSWNQGGIMKFDLERERVVYAQISALPDMEFLTTASRLGITNIPYVLWDSVPLSFVLDWALPVGQWLNGFDALLGMKFKGGHIGTIERAKVTNSVVIPVAPFSLSGSYAINVTAPKSFSRKLTDQWPMLPELRNPLTGLAWKAATTAALLAGVVKSSQRKPKR